MYAVTQAVALRLLHALRINEEKLNEEPAPKNRSVFSLSVYRVIVSQKKYNTPVV